MHVVLFCPYALWPPHFETELEIIQRHLDQGDRVTVLTCNGEMTACDVNPGHAARPCRQCVGRRLAGFGLLSGRIVTAPFMRLTADDVEELRNLRTHCANLDELKAYKIGTFDIGWAVVSSLVSHFRNPEIDVGAHAELIRRFVETSWIVHRSLLNYFATQQVDRCYLFNGRYGPLRAALRACQERGVPCVTHERGHDLAHYALFHNTFPHDRNYRAARIRAAWDEAGVASDRAAIATDWFERRAAGDGGNWHSFVAGQRAGQLPSGWDAGARNVVIFPSSEDEFTAIGDAWKNPIYDDQSAGIRALVASLAGGAGAPRLYLRVHPNLTGTANRQTREIAALDPRSITVIPAADSVSTYTLIRAAEKVVTFGSTVGIEAVYWGTPSILAGASFYGHLGATYNPATHAELVALVRGRLAPKPQQTALPYGYYFATFGTPFQYFRPAGVFSGTFKGRPLRRGTLAKARALLLRRAADRRVHFTLPARGRRVATPAS